MLIEAARRAEAAAREMLALVNAGEASCAEMREMLAVSKPTMAIIAAAQAAAAASISGRERHGDGGAEVLAGAAGLSRQEARSHIKTAEALRDTPKLRDALESGRVSAVNAKRLAEAAGKTSAADVESDSELLAKAESLRPEEFTKEARRWTVERQGDGGASEHARQRARRCVRMWDGDDGMVHLRGEFDAVTGRRIRSRLRDDAGRMFDTDNKNANKHNADNNGNGNGAGNDGHGSGGRRSFDQCMADALDNLTANSGARSGGGDPYADICVVAHVDEATGELIAQLPDGERLPPAVLEELACDARLTGVIYDRKGRPIWRTHPRRRPSDAQRQMLIARDGGCFACGTDPDLCDIHMSNLSHKVDPPASTTSCWPAGNTTTPYTTSAGRYTARRATAPCTPQTPSTTAPPTPPTSPYRWQPTPRHSRHRQQRATAPITAPSPPMPTPRLSGPGRQTQASRDSGPGRRPPGPCSAAPDPSRCSPPTSRNGNQSLRPGPETGTPGLGLGTRPTTSQSLFRSSPRSVATLLQSSWHRHHSAFTLCVRMSMPRRCVSQRACPRPERGSSSGPSWLRWPS